MPDLHQSSPDLPTDVFSVAPMETEQLLQSIREERDMAARFCDELSRELNDIQGLLNESQTQNRELATKLDEQRRLVISLTKSRGAAAPAAPGIVEQLTKERDAALATIAELETKLNIARDEQTRIAATRTTPLTRPPDALLEQVKKERDTAKAAYADLESKMSIAKAQISLLTRERDALIKATNASAGARLEAESRSTSQKIEIPRESARPPKPPEATGGANALTHTPEPFARQTRDTPPSPTAPPVGTSRIPVIAPPSPPPAPVRKPPTTTASGTANSSRSALAALIETAPDTLNSMRRCLHSFIKSQGEMNLLNELQSGLSLLTGQLVEANLTAIHAMVQAVESLIDDLAHSPSQVNPSTLRTLSQSLDFLVTLVEPDNITRIRDPRAARVLAVDDDKDAREIIRASMDRVSLHATCAADPSTTLRILEEQRFDLIFIDVGLPEMTGFDLCAKIRTLKEHKEIPVVFITGAVTVQNRVQSSLSGGNDFIAKPFNVLELGAKALTWTIKGQLGIA